jgi:hypothetical protein
MRLTKMQDACRLAHIAVSAASGTCKPRAPPPRMSRPPLSVLRPRRTRRSPMPGRASKLHDSVLTACHLNPMDCTKQLQQRNRPRGRRWQSSRRSWHVSSRERLTPRQRPCRRRLSSATRARSVHALGLYLCISVIWGCLMCPVCCLFRKLRSASICKADVGIQTRLVVQADSQNVLTRSRAWCTGPCVLLRNVLATFWKAFPFSLQQFLPVKSEFCRARCRPVQPACRLSACRHRQTRSRRWTWRTRRPATRARWCSSCDPLVERAPLPARGAARGNGSDAAGQRRPPRSRRS